jgi:hypothetical protein
LPGEQLESEPFRGFGSNAREHFKGSDQLLQGNGVFGHPLGISYLGLDFKLKIKSDLEKMEWMDQRRMST